MYKYVGNGKGWLCIDMLGGKDGLMHKYVGIGKGWLCIDMLGMGMVGYV